MNEKLYVYSLIVFVFGILLVFLGYNSVKYKKYRKMFLEDEKKYKRFQTLILIILMLSIGVFLILKNLNDNIAFFLTPSELISISEKNKTYRVGGVVVKNTIKKLENGEVTEFCLSDNKANVLVYYRGILPNLFRENQGIIAKGKFENNIFYALELLAKHDENYMPKEMYKLKNIN